MEAYHSYLHLDTSHNASSSTSSPSNMLTGPRWWIIGLVYHRHDYNWVEPMLLWMIITIRILTFYIPAHYALVYISCTNRQALMLISHQTTPIRLAPWYGYGGKGRPRGPPYHHCSWRCPCCTLPWCFHPRRNAIQ